jgi:Fic family protein
MTSNSDISFLPALPAVRLGELKDLAQQVIIASATLDGRIARETAAALGDRLRFLNSYHSNLIEGHKTSVLEIEAALNKDFSGSDQQRYSQELCAAHVRAERALMQQVLSSPPDNMCRFDVVAEIHQRFYEQLPDHHLYTHGHDGFTHHDVLPGRMRDRNVSLDDGRTAHGPPPEDLSRKYGQFERIYNPTNFHGDEKIIAAAASHHRFSWLHPFRDGNGRVARLFSGLYLALCGINRSNLWSLSRGFSRAKQWYMTNLRSADSPNHDRSGFDQDFFADYCHYFLEVCLDQIVFMDNILGLQRIDARIDAYINARDKKRGALHPLDPRAGKLLKALFLQGAIARGEARSIMGMENQTHRHARRIVSQLSREGLIQSASTRAPLHIAFPTHVLHYYFPDLFDPSVMGDTQNQGQNQGRG